MIFFDFFKKNLQKHLGFSRLSARKFFIEILEGSKKTAPQAKNF
jgi:hypothetical protein